VVVVGAGGGIVATYWSLGAVATGSGGRELPQAPRRMLAKAGVLRL
jgi:hypothetical protein